MSTAEKRGFGGVGRQATIEGSSRGFSQIKGTNKDSMVKIDGTSRSDYLTRSSSGHRQTNIGSGRDRNDDLGSDFVYEESDNKLYLKVIDKKNPLVLKKYVKSIQAKMEACTIQLGKEEHCN